MRTLQIRWARGPGAIPLLVAVALMPACEGNVDLGKGGAGGGTSTVTQTGTDTDTATGNTGGSGGGFNFGGFGGAGATDICMGGPTDMFIVQVPDPGVPAEPGAICAEMSPTVVSNTAARVKLTKYSAALNLAMGLVEVPPDLLATVVADPVIEITAAGAAELQTMQVSNFSKVAEGFSFFAEWDPFDLPPESWVSLTLKTTLIVQCGADPNDTRTVEAFTFVNLCIENNEPQWMSSGDECKVCDLIAEAAPSPIVPDKKADDLPLAHALRLSVRPIAKVGRQLVLLAENDGGESVAYDWHLSGGTLEKIAPDVVVWTPPTAPGPHMVQAAAMGEHTAGVASYVTEGP